jgi:hypothetical protein
MKKLKNIPTVGLTIAFILSGILFPYTLHAQDLLWKANFTGAGNNIPNKSTIDSENNIYILSSFSSTCSVPSPTLNTSGGNDIAITKYDANGNHIWTQQIGGMSNDFATGIVVSPDDEYIYITGYFQETVFGVVGTGGFDGFLAKYKNTGERVWFKNIVSASAGVTTNQRPNGIKIDKNNNLVIAGWFFTEAIIGNAVTNIKLTTAQPIGLFVAKFDTSGTVLAAKKIETTDASTKLYTLDLDTSGYYLAGYYKGDLITDIGTKTSNNNSVDIFVYKVGFDLTGKGIITVGGSSNDYLTSCSMGDNGYFYFGGYFASPTMTVDSTTTGLLSQRIARNKTSDGKYDIFFAKYRSDGQLQWFNTAGSTENDYLYRALYKNGNFIAAGQYGATLTFNNKTIVPKSNADAFAIVQNQNDNLVYLMPFGGTGSDVGETAVVDNLGNFVVMGDYTSDKLYIGSKDTLTNSNAGTKDMFVVKYDKGSLTKVVTPIACPGSATGGINLTPEGTVVAPYKYAWTKDGDATFSRNTEDISGLSAGTYRVTFTDSLGYTKKDAIVLTDPAPITITLDSLKNETCYNGADGKIYITPAGGTGSFNYSWSSNNGSGINAIAQDQVTLSKGTYQVTVSDIKGCTASLTDITITQPQRISFDSTKVTRINGHTGSIDLTVKGGTPSYSYKWTGPEDFKTSAEDISGLTVTGDYSVSVTDANTCTADTTILVPDKYDLMAYVGTVTNVKCNGGSDGSASIIVENNIGAITYTWSNGASTASVSNLSAGDYTVTVTDNCPTDKAQVNIHISQPSAALTASISRSNITCHDANNGIIDANPAGGTMPYTYKWTKNTQTFDGGSETQSGLSEGTYAVTVTDANGCTASSSNTIVNPDIITFTGTITGITCENSKNDGIITLSNLQGGSGSYTYQWSNGYTTQNATLLPAGNYSVTVTDANYCTSTNNYIVGYDSPMILSVSTTDVKCNGLSNGALYATASGGHDGFTYKWNTGATSNNLTNVVAGTYTVTVTDSKNCQKISSETITEPELLTISSYTQNNVSCFGSSNGSVLLSVSGGTPTYNYTWDQGAGSASSATSLSAGTYNVTVTDNNNCTTKGTYTITEPKALGLTEDLTKHINPLCYGSTNGSLTVIASGGSGEYEYSKNGEAFSYSPTYSGYGAGEYTLRVRDKKAISCIYSMPQAIVLVDPQPLILSSATVTNVSSNGATDGKIMADANGGTSPYLYTLNPTNRTQTGGVGVFNNLSQGDYTVTVTDANNCGPVTSNTLTISYVTSAPVLNQRELTFFPNPTTDYIMVKFDGLKQQELIIEIVSVKGSLVRKEKIDSGMLTSGEYKIDLQGMAKGMYLVKVNGKLAKDKIVLQ